MSKTRIAHTLLLSNSLTTEYVQYVSVCIDFWLLI